MLAFPVRVPPPLFSTVKVRSAELPTRTSPKSRELGVTEMTGPGTKAKPLTTGKPVGPIKVPAPVLGSIEMKFPASPAPASPPPPVPPYNVPLGPNSRAEIWLNPVAPTNVPAPVVRSMVIKLPPPGPAVPPYIVLVDASNAKPPTLLNPVGPTTVSAPVD